MRAKNIPFSISMLDRQDLITFCLASYYQVVNQLAKEAECSYIDINEIINFYCVPDVLHLFSDKEFFDMLHKYKKECSALGEKYVSNKP